MSIEQPLAASVVTVTFEGDCAQIQINNPPVNATSQAVRQGLLDAVAQVQGAARAILSCAGRTFVAGGDMSEFDAPPQEPHLPDVAQAIEDSATPIIAAMHGTVLGGGFELALACAYRVAAPGTRFGLPEVSVGLVPGAGGTQRAPRLVGWDMAVDMACLGKLVPAARLAEVNALDAIAEDPVAAAKTLPLPQAVPVSQRIIAAPDAEWIETKRKAVIKSAKGAAAPLENFEILLKASEPFATGQPAERARHLDLRRSDESQALRHAFFAERAVRKPKALADASPRDLASVAIVGGGLMGAGIATSCLLGGLSVTLIERDQEAASAAEARVHGLIDGAAARGKLTEEGAKAKKAAFAARAGYAEAAVADLAVEAVFEDVAVKREVFANLAEVMGPDAILGTNTSYLDPQEIFEGLPNPDRCVGLHFFSPAHIMKLVEVVQTPQTSPSTLATAFALAGQLRKVPVLSGICDGFIGNRMLAAYRRAAEYLLADGALPHEIDAAMTAFGMNMGPFAAQDMGGLQIALANRRRQDATRDPGERYVTIADQLCAADRLGQRTGKGWYRYAEGSRTPEQDPEVEAVITGYSNAQGITRRAFSAEEIQDRLLAVLANEGARIVEEGIAEDDGAVDVVKLHGYGFPRWRGGPMQTAKAFGTARIKDALAALEVDSPGAWVRAQRYR